MGLRNIFIVLLLGTSSFALPRMKRDLDIWKDVGIAIVDEFVDSMTNGTAIQTTIIDNVNEIVSELDELMQQVEDTLVTLTAEIGVINSDKIEVTREAIKTYRNVKSTLRITRNELKRLSHQTILITGDLLIYMNAWNSSYPVNEQKEYLKEQATIMQQLLATSKIILADAKTKYDDAAKDITTVNNKLESFKQEIEQMLDENSAEHKSWTTAVRAGVYSTAGTLTAAMIVADIFGCLGYCSATVSSSAWITGVSITESAIKVVSDKMTQMEETVLSAVDDIDNIGEKTKIIQQFIQDETIIIIQWENSVDHVKSNIGKIQEESFYRLNLKREVFTHAVEGLRDAAQKFWDRPDGIFGGEPLSKKLNDPEERKKNLQAQRNVEERRKLVQ